MLTEIVGHRDDEDLYPATEDRHRKLLGRIEEEFLAAESAQRAHRLRWERYYQHYRSYRARKVGDWRSRVFLPVTFYVIETIIPRMVAQAPSPIVRPVGPEDVEGARRMEAGLDWSFDQSGAFLHVMNGFKSALMYGTGILKTFHGERKARRFVYDRPMVPITAEGQVPVFDPETGQPLLGLDGEVVSEMAEMMLGAEPGEPTRRWEDATVYSGPACRALDISNFLPAPGAESMEDAVYVIERAWRDKAFIERQVAEGVYRIPDGMSEADFWQGLEEPARDRLASVGLDGGAPSEHGRKMVEIWERWDEETVTHILGGRAVVRVARNPYSHGEKPYVRIVDHLVPHEIWGIGEIQPLEGLQDVLNALTNSRIDQIKISLLAPYLVDEAALVDRRELQLKPGALIRVRNNWGLPLEQIIQKVSFGEVPTSSFEETALIVDMIERTSGVSDFQLGTESGRRGDTATGIAIISEQGNTRFAHKLKVAELTGLRSLARHYGTNLQQFMPEEMRIRVFNPEPGQDPFDTLRPEELQGAFDYDIESESSAVTESMRKEQDLTLFTMFANDPLVNQRAIREKVFRSFGVKDVDTYLVPEQPALGPFGEIPPPGGGAAPPIPGVVPIPGAA